MANSAKVDEAEQRKTRNEQAEFKNNDTNNGIHRDTVTVPVLRPGLDGILGKKDVPPTQGDAIQSQGSFERSFEPVSFF